MDNGFLRPGLEHLGACDLQKERPWSFLARVHNCLRRVATAYDSAVAHGVLPASRHAAVKKTACVGPPCGHLDSPQHITHGSPEAHGSVQHENGGRCGSLQFLQLMGLVSIGSSGSDGVRICLSFAFEILERTVTESYRVGGLLCCTTGVHPRSGRERQAPGASPAPTPCPNDELPTYRN